MFTALMALHLLALYRPKSNHASPTVGFAPGSVYGRNMSKTGDNYSTHVILLAHGSRDSHWTSTFEVLYERLGEDIDTERVQLAFMELASPSLENALDSAAAKGASRVEVLPLFFAAGRHLREDVPRMLEAYKNAHPKMEVELLKPLGEQPAFTQVMLQLISSIIGSKTT